MKEQNETVKEIIEKLLKMMGFDATVEIENSPESDDDGTVCNILTKDDSNLLIGQYGANLQALQHIARLLVRKSMPEKARFLIDINSYRKEKNASVLEAAKEAAQQAILEKRAVVMKPMSNYERRIVHMELSKDSRIATESIGEGDGRKVVIKPVDLV